MYSPEMRYRVLARLAADASGLEDENEREKFREQFIKKLRNDPNFLKALEERAKNLSTAGTEIGQGSNKE